MIHRFTNPHYFSESFYTIVMSQVFELKVKKGRRKTINKIWFPSDVALPFNIVATRYQMRRKRKLCLLVIYCPNF